MKRKALAAGLALLLLWGGWTLIRRHFQDDERLVREAIEDMRLGAEARDVPRVMSHFSKNYDSGNTNLAVVTNMAGRVIGALSDVRVTVSDLQVIVTGDTAYATMKVTSQALKRGKMVNFFGSDENPERPRVTFTREGSRWLITSVEDVQGNY